MRCRPRVDEITPCVYAIHVGLKLLVCEKLAAKKACFMCTALCSRAATCWLPHVAPQKGFLEEEMNLHVLHESSSSGYWSSTVGSPFA